MRFIVQALLPILVAANAGAATVTGTVTEAPTHATLKNMVVAAYDATGILRGTAGTDTTGVYVLSLPVGEYRLLAYDEAGVYATAFDGNAESFETSPLRSIPIGGTQVSFTLVKGGVVSGKVQPAITLLQDAVVEAYNLSGTRRAFTATNNIGDYSLVLPPGDYKVVAYARSDSYAVTFYDAVRSFAEATPVQVLEGQTYSVNFTLGVAAHVSGTAVDAATGLTLPSVLVYAYTPAGAFVSVTTTNSSGAFQFALPAGDYRFVAADASRVYATAYHDGSRSFEGASTIVLAAGEQRNNLQLALTRGARIAGHVNAPGFVVAAYNLDGTLHASTTSDAAGNYVLVVAPGDLRIAVSDPSLVYATLFYGGAAAFRFASTLSVTGDLAGIDVTLPRGGHVSGTVRGPTFHALSGINVAAYDAAGIEGAPAISGIDGRYTLVVAPGVYKVVAFDSQFELAASYTGGATSYETCPPLTVDAGAVTTDDFTMRSGVRVNGVVLSPGGDALTGMEVYALDPAGNHVGGATSKSGAFTIAVLPGTYHFVAVDPFRRYAPADPSPDVLVDVGQTPPVVTLTLKSITRRRSVRN
jgi:hypothetical protein